MGPGAGEFTEKEPGAGASTIGKTEKPGAGAGPGSFTGKDGRPTCTPKACNRVAGGKPSREAGGRRHR